MRAVTVNLGTLLSGFYGVEPSVVPVFVICWALSNFAGQVLLGRLFDTVGRKPMITLTLLALPLTMAEAERRDESAAPEDDLDRGIAGRA
jgi:MFS family permease